MSGDLSETTSLCWRWLINLSFFQGAIVAIIGRVESTIRYHRMLSQLIASINETTLCNSDRGCVKSNLFVINFLQRSN